MGEHPTVEEVRAFAQGGCGRETARKVVKHLLRGCSPCREAIARQSRMEECGGLALYDYDAAFERAAVPVRRRAERLPRTAGLGLRVASPH
ncbi:MAG: hypothetical protein QOF89_6076 [Acidobacteriota bacterium]|jgi:hypothetical protein|nr:hypothetical protein [Acidobacteriota bacterium]